MGLDMYLNRMPRYKDTTIREIDAIEWYLNWQKSKSDSSEYADCTLKEWCGIDESELPSKEIIDYYKQFYNERYYAWDDEHKYGHYCIIEQVGYWRKANQIHNWFIEHVQDGEDDCCYHNEVTKEVLEELLDTCEVVLASCELVPAKIKNGYTYNENGRVYNYVDGMIVKDPSVAERLLPSCSGFFFGGTDYDEYYINDIKYTIDIVTKVLETTNFEKEMIYYVSSW